MELKGAQEVEKILLLLRSELPVEVVDDGVRFRALAGVLLDGVEQIAGTAIVQEENTLAEAPERRRAELIGAGCALRNTIRKIRTHVMDEQVGKEIGGDLA